ncbi:sugar phosphate nucleotidyltransferase [Candidatus Halobonum tyrrellensis]|uniref:Nucleoside-diphosphate-sugar pyrophosphorylase n=1 Tax=Candidatus Halobonum tyrrellensis G22 TaxID=1324957 RepID=V4HI11_9EURY|nr:NDP-sugar synthase [Candidatus Halobonum tyrrellensis]ESP89393.1 nucleoside-diphosphate-sugar pyrophosphorylase [Candidatus Halobonum tyrrellensis G22]
MKAVVLAGGYATRLWPITRHRPKMFLPVGDGTVIDQVFDDFENDDRVDEVFVSTNERFADRFEEYLADSEFDKPTVSVEDTSAESEKFGVVGALAQLVDRENVDDDLVVVAGDNLISFGMSEFIDFFESKGASTLAAYDVETAERAKAYGIVDLDGDRVVDFQEKPEDPKSTLVSIACYAYTRETLPKLETYLENGNNPDEPGWFIQWLQSREDVYAFTFDDAWFDIGTPESYLEAVAWSLGGDNYVHPDATVENSEMGDNVHVMAGAEVTDSSLDRSVVFENAIIRDADIRESIIDEETIIDGLDLSGALIGAHSELHDGIDG